MSCTLLGPPEVGGVYLPTGPKEVADLRTELEAALEEVEADPDQDATVAVQDHIRSIGEWLE